MTRGYPDYGVIEEFGEVLLPTDIAELATRITGLMSYDRRGLVALYDAFEDPVLKWGIVPSIAGGDAELSSASVKLGSQALYLYAPAGVGESTYVVRGTSLFLSNRIGSEISFNPETLAFNFYLYIYKYDGTNLNYGGLRLNTAARTIAVIDAAGVWQNVATTGLLSTAAHQFYPIKLVVDFSTSLYARLLFGGVETDLSAYSLVTQLSGLAPLVSTLIYVANLGAPAQKIYLDEFILTRNEP